MRALLIALSAGLAHSFCAPSKEHTHVTGGTPTYLCLKLEAYNHSNTTLQYPVQLNDARWREFQAFKATADEFARFVVKGSYDKFNNATGSAPDVYMRVESLGANSTQKIFAAQDESAGAKQNTMQKGVGVRRGWFFPQVTAVVVLKDGVVQGISWDEGCHMCASESEECQANQFFKGKHLMDADGQPLKGLGSGLTCGVSREECDKYPGACDLTVYVAWTGTDKAGNYMKSSSKRFSRFRTGAVEKYWSGAKAGIKTAVSTAKQEVDNL